MEASREARYSNGGRVMKYKHLSHFAWCALSLSFIACSDAEIQSSDISEISQSIFVVPETYRSEPYKDNLYKASDKFYVNLKDKIRICGVYSIDGEYVTAETAMPYYNTHKWTIDDYEASATSVYYSFDEAGIHDVTFETIDHLGDTLLSKAKIYVSTPATITLQSPANNYNQVDGKNENGVELSWSISGIDPWESSLCVLYASYDRQSIWSSPLGELDCSGSVNLMGELDAITTLHGDTIDHSIDNSTIYWAVQADIKNEKGWSEHAFSEVFSFSTKLKNKGDAVIEIPVSCKFNQYPEKSILNGTFISAAGDTLSKISGIKSNSVVHQTLSAQSGIKFVVCDSIRKEYDCTNTTFDLAPSTKTILDTLFLLDKTKPNMIPVQTELPTSAKIQFYILDNGAGVNVSKVQAFLNNDSLQTAFDDYTLSITNLCKKECVLIINAEDYAHNKAPDVYWKVKVNGSVTKITGPFAKLEGDE